MIFEEQVMSGLILRSRLFCNRRSSPKQILKRFFTSYALNFFKNLSRALVPQIPSSHLGTKLGQKVKGPLFSSGTRLGILQKNPGHDMKIGSRQVG